ncbi:MAG TPA: hypothetical protein PKD37_05440 [Oligoflexia bacterium]|nr:hypothetical protein [Oligoflexia bacterium]HMP27409.1 hypothetical protein [Oligoflexia bacterium]
MRQQTYNLLILFLFLGIFCAQSFADSASLCGIEVEVSQLAESDNQMIVLEIASEGERLVAADDLSKLLAQGIADQIKNNSRKIDQQIIKILDSCLSKNQTDLVLLVLAASLKRESSQLDHWFFDSLSNFGDQLLILLLPNLSDYLPVRSIAIAYESLKRNLVSFSNIPDFKTNGDDFRSFLNFYKKLTFKLSDLDLLSKLAANFDRDLETQLKLIAKLASLSLDKSSINEKFILYLKLKDDPSLGWLADKVYEIQLRDTLSAAIAANEQILTLIVLLRLPAKFFSPNDVSFSRTFFRELNNFELIADELKELPKDHIFPNELLKSIRMAWEKAVLETIMPEELNRLDILRKKLKFDVGYQPSREMMLTVFYRKNKTLLLIGLFFGAVFAVFLFRWFNFRAAYLSRENLSLESFFESELEIDQAYQTLGLPRSATKREIKSRFRSLVKELHSIDANFQNIAEQRGGERNQKLISVTESYKKILAYLQHSRKN